MKIIFYFTLYSISVKILKYLALAVEYINKLFHNWLSIKYTIKNIFIFNNYFLKSSKSFFLYISNLFYCKNIFYKSYVY